MLPMARTAAAMAARWIFRLHAIKIARDVPGDRRQRETIS